MKQTNNGFFVYNKYIKPAQKVLSQEQFKDFVLGMVLYGVDGSYPSINPMAEVFLLGIIPFIGKYDRKYKNALKGGAHGGRKPITTKDEIISVIQNKRISSIEELASYFHCSKRTIIRRITKAEILQYSKENTV